MTHAAMIFVIVSCMVLSSRAADAIMPGARLSFGVLGPLLLSSQRELGDFGAMLSEAKAIGVQTVSMDMWWGIVQPISADDYDWSYYDKVFGMIRDHGLKIIPIMAFHKCGGGPGDACDIPVPAWVFKLAPDMTYESGCGHIHDDAVSVWATKEPAVLAAFRDFMQNFGIHFSGFSDDFAEINISLGPTGELRYPSYNLEEWTYPQAGVFQFYSPRASDDFRQWALDRFGGLTGVSERWGVNLASASEIRVPPNHDAFINNHSYEATPYGRDLIDWYNGSLVDHGARLLATANQALAKAMPSVPFGIKIPGVHWQMQNTATPRIAEITAGLVQTSKDLRPVPEARKDGFGYEAIMSMIASTKKKMGRELVLHFTAVEMDNDPPSCPSPINTSMVQTLALWISDGATDRDITHKAENALACVDSHDGGCDGRSWQHIATVFDFAPYGGLTFLRLSQVPDELRCIPWNAEDRQDYASFIGAFKDARTIVVHLSEWEPCFAQTDGCSYSIFTWDNSKPRPAPFGLHYEGPQVENGNVCRQWWTGVIANVRSGFAFTSNHTTDNDKTWEDPLGEFDRIYDPGQHGNEIFVLGRQNTSVFTVRPPCL